MKNKIKIIAVVMVIVIVIVLLDLGFSRIYTQHREDCKSTEIFIPQSIITGSGECKITPEASFCNKVAACKVCQ